MARIEWIKDVVAYNKGTITEVREEYPMWTDVMDVGAVLKGAAKWLDPPPEWAETVTLPLAPFQFHAYFPSYCMERPCEPDPKNRKAPIGFCKREGSPGCGRTVLERT